jgi:hypothetical protein
LRASGFAAPRVLLAAFLAFAGSAAARAAELSRTSIVAEYDSGQERFRGADRALNEARLATSDPARARQRVARLEAVLESHPDYPYRPMVRYFLGLNLKLLGEHGRAAEAFEAALEGRPDLAHRTPIMAYLRLARQREFVERAPRFLLAALALLLLVSVLPLFRADPSRVPWRRLGAIYGPAALLWPALLLVLPPLAGTPATGLEGYPRPALVNTGLGQLGDGVLRSLLGYGLAAILAAALVAIGASLLRSRPRRAAATVAGGLLAAALVMALFYVQRCHGRASYDARGRRLVFLVKEIAWKHEVPEEMLPLYDEDFRKKIVEARRAKGR